MTGKEKEKVAVHSEESEAKGDRGVCESYFNVIAPKAFPGWYNFGRCSICSWKCVRYYYDVISWWMQYAPSRLLFVRFPLALAYYSGIRM